MNVFWGLIAFFAGLIVCAVLWLVGIPLLNALVTTGTAMYWASYGAIVLLSLAFLIVFPVMTVFSDEEGGAFKKLITQK